jgi:hypothetical protein
MLYHPVEIKPIFYPVEDKRKAETKHLSVCGFGLSDFEKAVNSYSNRVVLWDEGQIGLNQIRIYSLQDARRMQEYCISVAFEHEKEIELYNEIRTNIQTRTRIR